MPADIPGLCILDVYEPCRADLSIWQAAVAVFYLDTPYLAMLEVRMV